MPQAPSLEKVLVTGGTGFIGRHLLRDLITAGCRPASLTRDTAKVKHLPDDVKSKTRWIVSDLLNEESVRDVIRAERPGLIFHLAGVKGRGDRDRADGAALNVVATINLLEAAREAGARRVVIIGTADEYGRQPGPLKEDLGLHPVSEYGASKAEATRLAQAMFSDHGFPVVILRPFTVYGPHQPQEMFVAQAIECAVTGLPFHMTEGTQKRDLIFVNDVVRALIAAGTASRVEGRAINIGSGKPERLRDVARLVWELSASHAPLLIGSRQAAISETHDTWADITLARKLLNWEPRISLEKGLGATIAWARERLVREEVAAS